MKKRILALVLCMLMLMSTVALFSGCGNKDNNDTTNSNALVVMSEELDGLFNPFYSTTAADGTIVSMTQIGMITNKIVNDEIKEAFGEDEATVVLDYESSYDGDKDETTYTFVIKNGIKFSDGKPLTMHDVMFNLYVYLDPVYTGSSTMYSTDIKGLQAYRTQTFVDDDNSDADDAISQGALDKANDRINELINLYKQVGATKTEGAYDASYDKMISAISTHVVGEGYLKAIYTSAEISEYTADGTIQDKARAQLKADYEYTVKLFKEELERDYAAAKDSYTEDPYKSAPVKESTGGDVIRTGFDEIISFMFAEGFVTIKYQEGSDGKIDRTKIEEAILEYSTDVVKDMDSAVKYVYDTKVSTELHIILSYWATANTLKTEYSAKGKEILLAQNAATDGKCPNEACGYQNNAGDKVCAKCKESLLTIANISGIVSLGHTDKKGTQIKVNNTNYTVASEHNEDGTVNGEGYDVLQITINGVDPKAIWNFAFAVAPQHYYSPNQIVDIEKNRFGVDYGSFDFMKNEIQSVRNVKVPVGAGAYQATNKDNTDDNLITGFYSNNVVYFKRNENFNTVGSMENAKIEKVRYQVVSASNALNALESGIVHYISPQYTPYNMEQLTKLADKGIVSMSTDQLGYGYIGINAGKVPDIELRKAIMAAMNTALGKQYYVTGTAETIYWPMSQVSWAYPKTSDGKYDRDNGKEYIAVQFNREDAITMIKDYMSAVGASEGDSRLKLTFTIAGANVDDHPCYSIFMEAQSILNECGWDVTVVPDTQALTKLSTGSLAVWAAAWGSTIDPDMYQVYHKDSTATSTLAWGYREIKSNQSQYEEENDILNKLSDVIDRARETDDIAIRKELYKEAMSYVLDLAVELPVYQRDVLYAYNSNVIDKDSIPSEDELNPYSSPLDRIWELEFAD